MINESNRPLIPLRLPPAIICQGCARIPRPLHNLLILVRHIRRAPIYQALCTCLLHLRAPNILAILVTALSQQRMEETILCAISVKINSASHVRNLILYSKQLFPPSICHRLKVYTTPPRSIVIPPLRKSPSHLRAIAPSATHRSSLSSLPWSGFPVECDIRISKSAYVEKKDISLPNRLCWTATS